MLAIDFRCSRSSIEEILHSVGFSINLGNRVPLGFTLSQRRKRVDGAKELLIRHKQEPFLHRLVTCDEKWILLDNRQRSNQCLKAKQKPLPTANSVPHQKKLVPSIWWCREGVIFWELIKTSSSIEAEVYSSQLDRAQAELRRNRF